MRFPGAGWPALLAMALAPGLASGQMSSGIDPPRVEKVVRAGSRVNDTINFTNLGQRTVTVTVSIVDFEVEEDGKVVDLPPGSHATSISPHLRISPVRATVASGERFPFRYSVTTPEAFTQLRGMVFFEAVPEAAREGGRQVMLTTSMGIPVYIENRQAQPGRLDVRDLQWRRSGERGETVELELDVSNTGERNIRSEGFVEVRSAGGGFYESYVFNPGREAVLPGHRRRWQFRFGPVPGEELFLKLRFDTSSGSAYTAEHTLPAAAP